MEQTVKERLKAFIKYKGLSVNKFEKTCSLSQGFVKNIGKTIGTDSIWKIIQAFPDLSQNWLINGYGEMIKPEIELGEDGKPYIKKEEVKDRRTVDELKNEIRVLNDRVGSLIDQNKKLIDIIEKLTK